VRRFPNCRGRNDLTAALSNMAPFVLIPAAAISAVAGLRGRERTAGVFLTIAVLALIVPIAVSLW
jgi:hypothetical protein